MMTKGNPKEDPDESELRLCFRLTLALWPWSDGSGEQRLSLLDDRQALTSL